MNKNILYSLLLAVITSFAGVTAAHAEEHGAVNRSHDGNIVIQPGSTGSFRNLLYSVWGRLQALTPANDVVRQPGTAVATLGMRGARLADRGRPDTAGPAASGPESEELASYMAARRYAESGYPDEAVDEFGAFIDRYEDSELRPNALFALGVSQASTGDNASSMWTMIEFIDQYPQHPLAVNAYQLIEELEVLELLQE